MEKRVFELNYTRNFGTFPDLRGRRLARAKKSNIYIPLRGENFNILEEPGYLARIMIAGDLNNSELKENQIEALRQAFDKYKERINEIRFGESGRFNIGEKLRDYFAVENILGGNNGFR